MVREARSGVAWARDELFRRHLRPVRGFARRLLGDDQDLPDVVQEIMMEAASSLRSLRDPDRFSTWLGGVVVHTVHKKLRYRRTNRQACTSFESPDSFDRLRSPTASPEVMAELARVEIVLRTLPEKQRAALLLRRVDFCTLSEIAGQLGVSVSSAKRWLWQAEAKFDRRSAGLR